MDKHFVSRRRFAAGALAGTAIGAGFGKAALAQSLTATSELGPFYPSGYRGELDADLTRVAGASRPAEGQVIELMGRVLDRHGKPIRGAVLDLWQANTHGRYDHPQDPAVMPLDPGFQGFAKISTGNDGSWKIRTIKPGAYDSPIGNRPPHIHLDVTGVDSRIVTQMYFPENAEANARDQLLARWATARRPRWQARWAITATAGTSS
ncbi:hypothetical protein [Qipengyuania nanhaisediminis]|uniref:dioxygenase family protein n=1 Tax=Qipengyuania nanhaisediminis TaxID=604088 RepID=UPI0038B39452